jgi:hypothetical protein
MIILHNCVEVGLALAGETMSGAEELAIRPQHHPCFRLVASHDGKAMGGEAMTQFRPTGRIGTGSADIFADEGEVHPGPLGRLVLNTGESGSGAFAPPQMSRECVGHAGLAFRTQGGEDRQIVCPCDDGMTEPKFDLAGDLFMAGMIEARG